MAEWFNAPVLKTDENKIFPGKYRVPGPSTLQPSALRMPSVVNPESEHFPYLVK